MTDLVDVSHYLGIQVIYVVDEKITLCQSLYLKKVLNGLKITEYKPALVPMNLGVANLLLLFDGNADKEIIN